MNGVTGISCMYHDSFIWIVGLLLKMMLVVHDAPCDSQALDLGRGANPLGYMVEEIWQELARAKYLLWEQESTKRSWELRNLK